MTETTLLKKIHLAASKILPSARLFRNNVAMAWIGATIRKTAGTITLKEPRPLHAGLHKGSGDLIGWTTITITPDMVGQQVAVFTSVEVKAKGGRMSETQRNWLRVVREAGGIAIVARSPEDLEKITSRQP